MLRRVSALAALGVLVSAPVAAGVLLTYPTPPTGDAFYAAQSVVAGEATLGLGWLDAARTAPRPAARSGDVAAVAWSGAADTGAVRLFNPAEAAFGGVVNLHKRLPESAVGIFDGAELRDLAAASEAEAGWAAAGAGTAALFDGGIAITPEDSGDTFVRRIWGYLLDPELGTPVDIVWLSARVDNAAPADGDAPPAIGLAPDPHPNQPATARYDIEPELIDF